MKKLTLVIGDKNKSSWSLRPWLVLKSSGLKFKEVKIILDTPKTRKQILEYSPSGKVPALLHGKTAIWDSLAIAEFVAEQKPKKNLWPKDKKFRALARSYVAEMHSGFPELRQEMSMNLKLKTKVKPSAATAAHIERIQHLWSEALKQSKGPFLFGKFGIVDAFYAPVVFRFISYGVEVKDKAILKYMNKIQEHPAMKEWLKEALKE